MNIGWHCRGLYAITEDELDTQRLLQRAEAVLGAGVSWLQYRNKSASPELRQEQAFALLSSCRVHDVPLIVNDDWQLAARIGADGAHLGSNDGELKAAREALGPHALLGASCYDDIELARRAVADGASYIAFGAFYPSSTKPGTRRAGRELLAAAAALGVPRVAIGGITPDNARPLIDAGADLIAAISGVFGAADPAVAARAYRSCFAGISSPLRPTRHEP
ncbi:MAG: thiamine phosphate synthase [Pseudomonadota bacterium]|nr:thiamine phosphate synthase [Pseudomonadota bacterium]